VKVVEKTGFFRCSIRDANIQGQQDGHGLARELLSPCR
jgi:hypothetical protein